ncbi:MAG: methyltransferase domain-containing protein [Gammaproteobacteria bacterium]|nr:MAG: methyltransferase domain-containing protein [Gammaproteobacteria bacterium]
MKRVPEPELMEDPAQARAYAGADFEEPHARCVALLLERFPELAEARGEAVDLGCGPADIACRVARACPGLRILGVDGAEAMLAEGRARVAREGLGERVLLRRLRLPDRGGRLPARAFDLVFSNSLLHHLAEPLVLWRETARLARPGAAVFVMDLSRPADPAALEALVARYAAGEPEILRRDFAASLRAAYRPEEVRAQLRRAGLPLQVAPCSDRHWLAWGRLPP